MFEFLVPSWPGAQTLLPKLAELLSTTPVPLEFSAKTGVWCCQLPSHGRTTSRLSVHAGWNTGVVLISAQEPAFLPQLNLYTAGPFGLAGAVGTMLCPATSR